MKLSEYDDDTLLEEVKNRGFKICILKPMSGFGKDKISIGGVIFDFTA